MKEKEKGTSTTSTSTTSTTSNGKMDSMDLMTPVSGAAGIGMGPAAAEMEAFAAVTGVPVTFFSPQCQISWVIAPDRKICGRLPYYNAEGSDCRKHLLLAVKISAELGEPYYFSCPAGLIKIAVPSFSAGHYQGCFIAGPLIMSENETAAAAVLDKVLTLNYSMESCVGALSVPGSMIADLFTVLKNSPAFSAKKVSSLALLFQQCSFPAPKAPLSASARLRSPRTADSPASLLQYADHEFPIAEEQTLLTYIASRNPVKAQGAMTSYLNKLLVYETGSLEMVKNHLTELCVLVSRGTPRSTPDFEVFEFIRRLDDVTSIQKLKGWTETFAEHFAAKNLSQLYAGSSPVVNDAVRLLLSDDFFTLTLEETARKLHVNQSWFSTHFKKEMGMTFTDFMTGRRVEKAKELLTRTDLRLIEIASRCGFDEQSYFSRVFKKETGLSPRAYRLSQSVAAK